MLTWRKETKWLAVDDTGETYGVLEQECGKEWRIMRVGDQHFARGVATGYWAEQGKKKIEGAYAARERA